MRCSFCSWGDPLFSPVAGFDGGRYLGGGDVGNAVLDGAVLFRPFGPIWGQLVRRDRVDLGGDLVDYQRVRFRWVANLLLA